MNRLCTRFRRGGIVIDAITKDELSAAVLELGRRRGRYLIANHNLHSLALCRSRPVMASMYQRALWTHLDGMGAWLVVRALGGPVSPSHRTTYADWFPELLDSAEQQQVKVAYLGSRPETVIAATTLLQLRHPKLQVSLRHGFFDQSPRSADSLNVLAWLGEFRPHWIFLGMGMPRQEEWLEAHWELLPDGVVFQCGAALDYWSGVVSTPPRWMGRIGLEWLHRLAHDPRRLAHRYLCEPFVLIPWWIRARFSQGVIEQVEYPSGR